MPWHSMTATLDVYGPSAGAKPATLHVDCRVYLTTNFDDYLEHVSEDGVNTIYDGSIGSVAMPSMAPGYFVAKVPLRIATGCNMQLRALRWPSAAPDAPTTNPTEE